MQMNEKNIGEFRKAFQIAMKDLEKYFDVQIEIKNIRFNEAAFHTQLDVKNVDGNGRVAIEPLHEMKAQYALRHIGSQSLKARGVIGQKFLLANNSVVTIVDFDSKKSKYPVLYIRDGKRFKCAPEMITGYAN
jgi:hypothetical protein